MTLESLELPTIDLAAQRAFYGERLGFSVSEFEGGLEVAVGGSRLMFRHNPAFEGAFHFAFDVPRAKVEASEAALRGLGVETIPGLRGERVIHTESWDADSVYFRDPAGNVAEFIGRMEFASADDDPSPFSVADVIRISELGIACENVAETAARLGAALGTGGYREAGSEFFPLGDAWGLLILVPVGREWFPKTGIAARDLSSRAILAAETGRWALGTAPFSLERL